MPGLKDKVGIAPVRRRATSAAQQAIRLAEEGMLVVAADLNEAAAQTVVDEISDAGGTAVPGASTSPTSSPTRT